VRILVIGARGQLGSEIGSVAGSAHELHSATRMEADVTDLQQVRSLVAQAKPDVVVNAAAYTNVDNCESNQAEAFRVNALGARNVAIAARQGGAKLVQISTDYVFDGTKKSPYREYDPTAPLNVYGTSKLLGEELVKEQLHCFFIVRTAWLYGARGKNFVRTMLRLAEESDELSVVRDQTGTPTSARDVARQILALVETDLYGTYHCTSQGSCTWYEFAMEIFQCAGYKVHRDVGGVAKMESRTGDGRFITVKPVTAEEFSRLAIRPRNSVLENHMLALQALDVMPDWREALREFLTRCGRASEGGLM